MRLDTAAFTRSFLAAASCLLLAAVPARAWEGTLQEPAGGRWGAQTEIAILLPDGLEPEIVGRLALEVDDLDFTAVAAIEPGSVRLLPPWPMARGRHRVRLLEYGSGGGVAVRGDWSFVVRGAVEGRAAAQVAIQASRRVADDDVPAESLPERDTVQGSAHLEAGIAGGGGEAEIAGDLLYQTPAAEGLDDLELGEFLARASGGPATVRVGHHAPPAQGLLLRDFSRRGGSLETRFGDVATATGFALRAGELRGFRGGLGFSEPGDRVAGAVVALTPVTRSPERLRITGVVVDGRQREEGEGVYDPAAAGEGGGWSLRLDSELLAGRLRLHGEYAETSFEAPGGESPSRRDDEAIDAGVAAVPLPDLTAGGQPLRWEVGLTWQRVGTDFRTLANPGLPSDVETLQGYTRFGWGGHALEASASRGEDNVAGFEGLPRTASSQLSVQASAAFPVDEAGAGRLRRLIGSPRLTLGYQQGALETVDAPEAWSGGEVDSRTREWQATAGSSYGRLDWSAGGRWGTSEDGTGAFPELRTTAADASLSLRPFEWLDASLIGQRVLTRDVESGLEQVATLLRAEVGLQVVPGRLRMTAGLQSDRQDGGEGSTDLRTEALDLALEWTALKPGGLRPGLALWARGRAERRRDAALPENDAEPYQVFIGGTFSWAGAAP